MVKNDLTIVFGGDAGQGIQSSSYGLCQALGRSGLHVFGRQDYRSQIRGGHNFHEIRVKDEEILTHRGEADLLIALTEETVEKHLNEINEGGGVIYEEGFDFDKGELTARGIKAFPAPLKSIARDEGGSKIMANTAAIGLAAGLTGFDLSYIDKVIEDNFKKAGKEVVQNNLRVAKAGYNYADTYNSDFEYELEAIPDAPKRMIMDGNEAFVLGAIAGGVNFISAYPMTPSTSIFEGLTKYANEYEIVTKQTESELAAINMAIGAYFTGARAMVSTSGGGFSLMTEALGLAGMSETPVVIAEVQRPGPSTGLPTRTEQADLLFTINASQGEFPRLVLTPGTTEEYFRAGAEAFNLADKYQSPVIVLSDQHLADSIRTVNPKMIDMESVEIDRGNFLSSEDLDELEERYKRHEFTDSGVSPWAPPGHENAVYSTTGNEHNEYGEISEDREIRTKMVDKRERKLESAKKDMIRPGLCGPEDAEYTFISWGSSFGAVKEAANMLSDEGAEVRHCHLGQAWPLPEEDVKSIFENSENTVVVESNKTSQMGKLIRRETGLKSDYSILRYDGRPLTPDFVVDEFRKINGGK